MGENKEYMKINYYDSDKLTTEIFVDFKSEHVKIVNHTDDNIIRAFGVIENPSFKDFENFLEDRCFPRTRDHMKVILDDLGIPEYDPLTIVKRTQGRMAEDYQWLEVIEDE